MRVLRAAAQGDGVASEAGYYGTSRTLAEMKNDDHKQLCIEGKRTGFVP